MNIELNTPRTLSHRIEYVKDLTSNPHWTKPTLFQEVNGWKPGPELQKQLVFKEMCNLTKDLKDNTGRIEQWKALLKKTKGDDCIKYARMIRSWSKYSEALVGLRIQCQQFIRAVHPASGN